MRRASTALLLNVLLADTASAQEPWTTERYFALTDTPGFVGLTETLQRSVDDTGRTRINHFCVVGQELRMHGDARPSLSAITFWQEAKNIQGYGQGRPDEPISGLSTLGTLHVDLACGVVPTPNDIKGSTYLVDRGWVERLLRNCWRHGRTLVLIRHARERRGK